MCSEVLAICVFYGDIFKWQGSLGCGQCEKVDMTIDPQCVLLLQQSQGPLLRKCSGRSVRKIQQFICFRAETGFLHKVIPSQTAPTPNAHMRMGSNHIYTAASNTERPFVIKDFTDA